MIFYKLDILVFLFIPGILQDIGSAIITPRKQELPNLVDEIRWIYHYSRDHYRAHDHSNQIFRNNLDHRDNSLIQKDENIDFNQISSSKDYFINQIGLERNRKTSTLFDSIDVVPLMISKSSNQNLGKDITKRSAESPSITLTALSTPPSQSPVVSQASYAIIEYNINQILSSQVSAETFYSNTLAIEDFVNILLVVFTNTGISNVILNNAYNYNTTSKSKGVFNRNLDSIIPIVVNYTVYTSPENVIDVTELIYLIQQNISIALNHSISTSSFTSLLQSSSSTILNEMTSTIVPTVPYGYINYIYSSNSTDSKGSLSLAVLIVIALIGMFGGIFGVMCCVEGILCRCHSCRKQKQPNKAHLSTYPFTFDNTSNTGISDAAHYSPNSRNKHYELSNVVVSSNKSSQRKTAYFDYPDENSARGSEHLDVSNPVYSYSEKDSGDHSNSSSSSSSNPLARHHPPPPLRPLIPSTEQDNDSIEV